jgi:hypothetical protein
MYLTFALPCRSSARHNQHFEKAITFPYVSSLRSHYPTDACGILRCLTPYDIFSALELWSEQCGTPNSESRYFYDHPDTGLWR